LRIIREGRSPALPFLFAEVELLFGERTLVILQEKVAGLTEGALEKFLAQARRAAGLEGEVNVLITGTARIRSLNRRFRRKDKATDVLSFPALAAGFSGDAAHFVGDIAISAEIAAANAAQFGHSVNDEIKILILHGILHLAGFDHERDNGDMARKEAQLGQVLKLPSALMERVHSGKPYSAKMKRKRRRAGAATV
jgi:probable rRNA maturation factor